MNNKILEMEISTIKNYIKRPKIYERGNSEMWTDPHISKQLLEIHLNSEIDLGSRKMSTINKTIEWILSRSRSTGLNVLDLGCGPGLYSEKLANMGHNVTGVDFSESSIKYAQQEASRKNLKINYLNEDYLKINLKENAFDLVILIYTDFGVLKPKDQNTILNLIRRVLKPDGTFIFDVLNDREIESKTVPKNWEIADTGFWKNEPYIALSESFLYKQEKVILYQHTVIDEKEKLFQYRFWTHFFSNDDLDKILNKHLFENMEFHEDVLPKSDLWNGENVTFCIAKNTRAQHSK